VPPYIQESKERAIIPGGSYVIDLNSQFKVKKKPFAKKQKVFQKILCVENSLQYMN